MSTHLPRQRMITALKDNGITDARVLAAMSHIPREEFLTKAMKAEAYDNAALPIGEKQTISQPMVVARMTEALELDAGHRVLEIGTGCGYQTAILCKLARRVFSVERLKGLSESATQRLTRMGYHNFVTMVGDGTRGWPQQAPFERIIVTAAGPYVPTSLIEQLAPGGVLIMPVGEQTSSQKLVQVRKDAEGNVTEKALALVQFVPLIGVEGVELGKAS